MTENYKMDLADAQFIGFCHGKSGDLLSMVSAMGLTAEEWERWKAEYTQTYLTKSEIDEINDYFAKYEGREVAS